MIPTRPSRIVLVATAAVDTRLWYDRCSARREPPAPDAVWAYIRTHYPLFNAEETTYVFKYHDRRAV